MFQAPTRAVMRTKEDVLICVFQLLLHNTRVRVRHTADVSSKALNVEVRHMTGIKLFRGFAEFRGF